MKTNLLRLVLLLFLLPAFLHGQNKKPGKAPRRATRDCRTLAHALTDSLPNDSLKIRSIWLWEAKHIRYGMDNRSPGSILAWRSAVCLGYSILFDSLCMYAGIDAEVVIGYVYMPWFEANDTIHLDRHAWNAVMVDGEWKLMDVTWSRGKVVQKRQRMKRWICKKLNLTYVPRYKYKRKLTNRYFLPDPELMVLDHLPSTPAWQLLECSVPMDSFQRSPYATLNFLDNPVNCKHGNDSIPVLLSYPEAERAMMAGKQAMKFSGRSHFSLDYGTEIYAQHLSKNSHRGDLPWQTRLLYYDSSIAYLDSLTRYYRYSIRDCRNERDYLLRRNRRMLQQVNKESRPLYRKHLREVPRVRRERYRTYTEISKLKRRNRELQWESRKMKRKKIRVKRPERPAEGWEKQRDRISDKYSATNDSIEVRKEHMETAAYSNFSWEVEKYDSLVNEKKRFLQIMFTDLDTVLIYKRMGYTCYDTIVYSPKNQLLREQKNFDTAAMQIRRPGKWEMDSAANVYGREAAKAKMLIRLNMGLLRQLSRMPAGTEDEKAEFIRLRKEFVSINDSLIAYNKQRIKDLRRYRKSLSGIGILHHELTRRFRSELRGEAFRYGGTARFFRYYYRMLGLTCLRDYRYAAKWKGAQKRNRQKLLQEVRKRERAHLKVQRKEQKLRLKEN